MELAIVLGLVVKVDVGGILAVCKGHAQSSGKRDQKKQQGQPTG